MSGIIVGLGTCELEILSSPQEIFT